MKYLAKLDQLVNREGVSSSLGKQRKAKASELSASTPATKPTMVELEHHEELWPTHKLNFPFFSNEDLDGWVFKVKRYFRMNPMIEDEKMETLDIAMEGKALAWFWFVEDHLKFRGWVNFKKAMLMRFCSGQE